MSTEQASAFLSDWVVENIHSVAHPKDSTEAQRLAKRCVEDAEKQGITRTELEQAGKQDLVKCMCDAQVAVADAEIGGSDDDSDALKID